MAESPVRVGYYNEKAGTIALDLGDLKKLLNTGCGYHKITRVRTHNQ